MSQNSHKHFENKFNINPLYTVDNFKLTGLPETNLVTCENSNQLPCLSGYTNCYNLSDICIYRLNKYRQLIPCILGSHLQECTSFQCNMHFKCPGYYCILWGDGKWDCPDGYDESTKLLCGENRTCYNMIKCKNSSICISMEDLYDSYQDCPLKDNEMLCELKTSICPKNCSCLNFAISCTNVTIDMNMLWSKLPYTAYPVIFSDIDLKLSLLENLHVTYLNVTGSFVNKMCMLNFNAGQLVSLDVSSSNLKELSVCISAI